MTTQKKMMINNALKIFIIIDIGVVVFCLLSGRTDWLLNTQIAYFSSLMVTLGSYIGYKKNVQNSVKNHLNEDDNYDELDKMDDKYDLYSPEVEDKVITDDMTKEEIKEAMKPIKQNYFKNFKIGFSGMASFYRLFGYIGLVIGFFYLNNNGYLHIYSYMFGFFIVPLSSLVFQFTIRKNL
ncbi:MAG: hypothetical protein U9R37_03620 [Campylobacterota bacterium]|nr:hypothetical protein [Campylobacterota bacterium]